MGRDNKYDLAAATRKLQIVSGYGRKAGKLAGSDDTEL